VSELFLIIGFACSGVVVIALWVALIRARQKSRELDGGLERAALKLEHLERSFARFAPPQVVDRLSDGEAELTPEREDVTVMFADLVGFTRLSERLDPAVMVQILNGYFTAMSEVVTRHHGAVTRIMGDGLMAIFGTMSANPWHPADAARAAVEMRAALIQYNQQLASQGLETLQFGIGLHRGEAISAVVGSDRLMEFTAIGDPVNVAARIESLTRRHGVDILLTEDVRQDLDGRFTLKPMEPTPIKGKTDPIATYALIGYED
jgi:adenylate cyclase